MSLHQKLADKLREQWEDRKAMLAAAHDGLSQATETLKRATERERAAWKEYHAAQVEADRKAEA